MFIGPYDLSLAHGYPPPSPDPHPDVEVMIQDILRRSHAKGKKWSVHSGVFENSKDMHLTLIDMNSAVYCTSGHQSAKRVQEGFDMVRRTATSYEVGYLLRGDGFTDQCNVRQRCNGPGSCSKLCRSGGRGGGHRQI